MSNMLKENLKALWGYRSELGQSFDNMLQELPGIRDHVAPYAMERWLGALKGGMVNTMIKYSPRFHAVNSTQLYTTLWPIADSHEVLEGFKLWNTQAGKQILEDHMVNMASKTGGHLGPVENFNQGVAFMTMYNRALKYGLKPQAAGDYAVLRGNIYSQFHNLVTDRPIAFRRLDPTGAMTMFQRFTVKQLEQMMDLVRDRNVSGAAKWLSTIGLMGGYRALTFGGGGWLSYRMYKDIKDQHGEAAANTLHYGLPGLAGVDLSNTAMAYNPPFGQSIAERVGNLVMGPIGSVATSAVGAALNNKAIEPSMAKRTINALIQRLPVAKELDSIKRIIMDDYDIKTPDGKLKYKADLGDMLRRSLGFRPTKEANLQLLSDAILSAKTKRDEVLDYAASRYGQGLLSGLGIPKEMEVAIQKDVDSWNSRWPEMPITGNDLMVRAKARQEGAMKDFQERLLKSSGKVGKTQQFRGFEP
jgi:hypothetical protein